MGGEPDGETERTRQEYGELLEEIRVALPGVEVLFAFLLTAPFTERFEQMRADLKVAYFVALLFVAVACALLMAPTAHHRMRFHHGDKAWITRLGTTFALAAMLFLAVGVSVTLFVVSALIFSRAAAVAVGATSAVALLTLWYVIPWLRHRGRGPA